MYRRKVCYISLLEVIISLFLLSVISFSVIVPFRQLTRGRLSVAQGYASVHARSVLQVRLQELFERVDYIGIEQSVQGERLLFNCRQSLDRDPHFCGKIGGELGCFGGLLVLSWGNSCGEVRSQILFENIRSIHWDFFDSTVHTWVSTAPKVQDIVYVRLVIEGTSGENPLSFVFHTNYERENGISI